MMRPSGAGRSANLQRAAGHHRDSRYGRIVRRAEANCDAGPQDPTLPVTAVLRGLAVHGRRGQVRHAEGNHSRLPGIVNGDYDHLPEQAF